MPGTKARWDDRQFDQSFKERSVTFPAFLALPLFAQVGKPNMPIKSSSSVRVFYPKFDRAYLLKILSERLKILGEKLQLIRVVLFGSYAMGNYTVGSDVDLLIIYKGEIRLDVYALTKERLNIPRLEPHLYSEIEYKEMKETINKMEEGGIVLISNEED
jgi:predicted nucleotidyltransferase